MTDPVTIGTLAATALAMAAEAVLKGAVGEGVKDAYKALKGMVAHWAGGNVAALEKAPASVNRKALIAEAVDGQPTDEQAAVKALVAELLAALKKDGGGPVGLESAGWRLLKFSSARSPSPKGRVFA